MALIFIGVLGRFRNDIRTKLKILTQARLCMKLTFHTDGDKVPPMATPYFNVSVCSLGSGNGPVAGAAYRHGVKLKDSLTGRTFDYSSRDDVQHSEISLPEDAPDWAKQRYQSFVGDRPEARIDIAKASDRLWNDLVLHSANGKHSRRDKAQIQRRIDFALPIELTDEQQVELARRVIESSFAARGMVADWVIHRPAPNEFGQENPHVHVTLSMRDLGAEGWGNRNLSWDTKSTLRAWRMEWANETNLALERAGSPARIDHRTLAEQGIELEPDTYNPYVAEHAEKSGERAREKERIAQVRKDNAAYLRANPEHILTVVSAKATIFTELDIKKEFKRRIDLPAPDEIKHLVNAAMASRELVELDYTIEHKKDDEWPALTTRARAYNERNLMLDAKVLAHQKLDVDPTEGLELLADKLNETQRSAALEMLSADRLSLVTGYAGVGKTTTIGEAAKVWKARGFEVLGGAISGKATQELTGISVMESASLAAWEARWAAGTLPKHGKFVFFLDEIGMVGGDTLVRVLKRVSEMGGKLIGGGDGEQLQPVLDSSVLHPIAEVKTPALMDEIIRQNNPDEKKATWWLAQGGAHIDHALDYYDGEGHIHFLENNEAAQDALVTGYFDQPVSKGSERIAVAVSNSDVWTLQERLRDEAIKRGQLGPQEKTIGDIIRIDRSGTRQKRLISDLNVREGERLIFTAAHRELGIPKSSMGTVIRTPYQAMDILLDGADEPVRVNLTSFNSFDYAYAATIHKVQGMSKERVHVLAHPRMDRYLTNVAMTRHKDGVTLYVSETRVEDMEELKSLAHAKNHLWIDGSEHPAELRRSGTGLAESGLVADRLDVVPASEPVRKLVREAFIGDPHLAGIASRVGGLLASEFVDGDPILKQDQDPQGYALDPQRLIDDIMARQAVFRAPDVANGLTQITDDPETFLRLFREAMHHPDLLILDEGGYNGEGRVYSTRTQVVLEMNVIDRGVRLGLLEHLPDADYPHNIHDGRILDAEVKASELTSEQEAAFRAAVRRPGLSLVSGASGSGKTRVAGALARAYRSAGVLEVNAIAPTSAGVDRLRREGEDRAMSIRQFEERVSDGRIHLVPRSVIVLDDAGLLGAGTVDRLFALAEQHGSKIVAFMDDGQMAGLEASPVFRMLEARVGGHTLGESLRQVDARRTAMLEDFRQAPGTPVQPRTGEAVTGAPNAAEDRTERGLAALEAAGVFQAGDTRSGALDKVASAYVRDPIASKMAVALSRDDVEGLNTLIREKMDTRFPERAVTDSPFGSDVELQDAPVGSIAALRPGDLVRLPGGYRGADVPPGSEGEVLRHDAQGVALQVLTSDGAERTLTFSVEDPDFRYRFAFADTIHGARGRGFGSVHVLASPGLSRQMLHAAMALHQQELNVVLPVSEDRTRAALQAIQHRDGAGRGVLDYGFDVALAAREAQRGHVLEVRPDAIVEGADRVALWVGAEVSQPESQLEGPGPGSLIGPLDIPPARVLPHGAGGEVMAELIGGHILETGGAPTDDIRDALTRMAQMVVDPDRWQALQRRLPPEAEARAEQLALERAGPSSTEACLPAALGLARGAVASEGLGEDALAVRFQRGLDLYGARAEEARRGPGIETLEPALVDVLPDPLANPVPEPVPESPTSARVRQANLAYLREQPQHMMTLIGAERAIFTEEELVRATRSHLGGSRDEAQEMAVNVLAMPEVVQIAQTGPGGQAQFTTGARAAVEADLIRDGKAMAAARLDVDPQAHLDLLSNSLKPAQRKAALAMLSPNRLTLVTGFPGAGKSYTIGQVADVWRARGYEVLGGALSGSATDSLAAEVSGVDLATLAIWEERWERGWRPKHVGPDGKPGRFVFFMDEAGMVGGDTWARVQARVNALGGKLIVVGDPEQLQPVSESSALLALQDEIGMVVMDDIIRQDNDDEKDATIQLGQGGSEAIEALRFYHKKGDIRFTEDTGGAIAQIRARYFDAGVPAKRIALAYTNRDVWALNAALREEAIQRGVLGAAEHECGEIVRRLRDGDRERVIRLPLKLREGERVMFTEPHRELSISKSSFGTVQRIRNREIDILIDGTSRPVTLDLNSFSGLDYGYAATIHKSQGLTVDHVYALGHGYLNQHLLNVMLTRHRKRVTLFAPKDRLEDMASLEAAVLRKAYLRIEDIAEAAHPFSSADRVSGTLFENSDVARGRLDLPTSALAATDVAFEEDAHLSAIANRTSGFLASKFTQGDELIGADPRGYAAKPARVIDDLIRHKSTLRAADVANALSRITEHPATFLRLFREAMAHPDLVVLRRETPDAPDRIYSTRAQVQLESDVVDRGLRLALSDHLPGQPVDVPQPSRVDIQDVAHTLELDEHQADALRHVVNGPRLSLVRGGSGSGKTRLAGALADLYRGAGSDQVYTLAPTGAGMGALRQAGQRRVLSAAHFVALGEADHLPLSAGSVVILDDAGQLDADTASGVLSMVDRSGAQLILLADPEQPAPFAAGPVFRMLEARAGSIALGDSHRQQDPQMGTILAQLAASDGGQSGRRGAGLSAALDALNSEGVIHAAGTAKAALDKVAQDYVANPSTRKIALAWSGSEVGQLNARIRAALDDVIPERTAQKRVYHSEGSIAALRVGDRIALSARYAAADLQAGSTGEVLAHNEDGVRIRMQSPGAEAQEVVFKGEDENFRYRFAFASTVHGARGAGYDSVHMLVAPAMSREVLTTGMALHERELSLVVPSSAERQLTVLSRILQSDGRAGGVLDHGVDPALGQRQAIQDHVLRLQGDTGLPHGVGAAAMAETVAASIRDTGRPPAPPDQAQLSELISKASGRANGFWTGSGVSKTLTARAEQVALDRAGPGRDGHALPAAVVLSRAALLAETQGDTALKDRVERGLDLYADRARIARNGPGIETLEAREVAELPEAATVARARQHTHARSYGFSLPRLSSLMPHNELAAIRPFINLMPTSELAVARQMIDFMIPSMSVGPGFSNSVLKAFKEHSPRMAQDSTTRITRSHSGAVIVETDTPLHARHNESRRRPGHIDSASVRRMEARIRSEMIALETDQSFDARFDRAQAMIESGEINTLARDRIEREQATYLRNKPEIIASPALVYRDDPYRAKIVDRKLSAKIKTEAEAAQRRYETRPVSTYQTLKEAVAQDFATRYPDMPEHLARGLGHTYATAISISNNDGLLALERDTALGPDAGRPRLGHLARSLASAITQHVDSYNRVHEREDLRRDLRKLLVEGASFAPDDPKKIEAAAREIARQRAVNALKLDVIGKVLDDNDRGDRKNNPYYKRAAIYLNENPFDGLKVKLATQYEAELDDRIAAMTPDDYPISKSDQAIARATAFLPAEHSEKDKNLAKAVVRAASVEGLPDPTALLRARQALMPEIAKQDQLTDDQRGDLIERLYKAFTHKEITTLSSPDMEKARAIPTTTVPSPTLRSALVDLFNTPISHNMPWVRGHEDLAKNLRREIDRDYGREM